MEMNKCKTIIRPYNQAMLNQMEKWLSALALDGWRLVQHSGWKFVFEKRAEEQVEYFFLPAFDNSRGFYNAYHIASREYGKSRLKSKLNKTQGDVFEIDPEKVDSQLAKYKIVRNRFCIKHYGWLLGIISALMLASVTLVSLTNINYILVSIIPWLLPFSYSAVSLFAICKGSKKTAHKDRKKSINSSDRVN